MHAIKATWTGGQIVPKEPVDWPEGSELRIEPLPSTKIGLTEDEWRDDPEGIAEWLAWLDTVQPLLHSEEERTAREQFRDESKRFNIDAVRKQMGLGETP